MLLSGVVSLNMALFATIITSNEDLIVWRRGGFLAVKSFNKLTAGTIVFVIQGFIKDGLSFVHIGWHNSIQIPTLTSSWRSTPSFSREAKQMLRLEIVLVTSPDSGQNLIPLAVVFMRHCHSCVL